MLRLTIWITCLLLSEGGVVIECSMLKRKSILQSEHHFMYLETIVPWYWHWFLTWSHKSMAWDNKLYYYRYETEVILYLWVSKSVYRFTCFFLVFDDSRIVLYSNKLTIPFRFVHIVVIDGSILMNLIFLLT